MDWDSTIKGFIAYLTLEKGLSGHSIEAYTRDVRRIALFMVKDLGVNSPTAVTSHQIEQFLHVLNEVEISHRTQARMLSGIRAFYQYLILEDMLAADPTELVDSPKTGQYL
ncbi:MAG TPA: site-specific integrase, partial [Saprospiraceae bacterium]|nr:site-specific integrase [Saprospiraceae bacterium]